MRITLDIDDDVLVAVRELSRLKKVSAGEVVSQLLRPVLGIGMVTVKPMRARSVGSGIGGFRPFAPRGGVLSNAQVNELRDADDA